mgnify:CR=1 FL=1
MEAENYLRRKCEGAVREVAVVEREDLDLVRGGGGGGETRSFQCVCERGVCGGGVCARAQRKRGVGTEA